MNPADKPGLPPPTYAVVHAINGDLFNLYDETTVRRLLADERSNAHVADGMAQCLEMIRADLIAAGVIDKSVPPMMMAEAVMRTMQDVRRKALEEAAALVESTQCTTTRTADDTQRHLTKRSRGNIEGMPYAAGIRALIDKDLTT